jgi:hypothetical protein
MASPLLSVEEIDIWRAAKKMIELYPEGAEIAAATRADAALDQGDVFNFNLWKRVTKAIHKLECAKPRDGETIN